MGGAAIEARGGEPAQQGMSGAPSDAPRPVPATSFACRVARTASELDGYFRLRRAIFCDEQGLFRGSDRDELDDGAIPIVCVAASPEAPAAERVVGVVRVWEEAPGDYWGGRLGVARDLRTVGGMGKWLIQTAVGSARAWGAWRFRANVQRANVPLFRRLHWTSLGELAILGTPHHLMQADLARYAPTSEARPLGPPASSARPIGAADAV